jgi:act minimal PKS acyl carrier protein
MTVTGGSLGFRPVLRKHRDVPKSGPSDDRTHLHRSPKIDRAGGDDVSAITLQRLAEIMVECGDRDPGARTELDDSIGDTSFEELGFDSLSLFNTLVEIEDAYPVQLSLDVVLEAQTPNELLALVNQNLARSA